VRDSPDMHRSNVPRAALFTHRLRFLISVSSSGDEVGVAAVRCRLADEAMALTAAHSRALSLLPSGRATRTDWAAPKRLLVIQDGGC
jgi:hypothetical protein